MLRIATCDDDLNFLDSFSQLITKSFTGSGQIIEVVKFSRGGNLIEKIEKQKQFFDIIFLDVEMPQLNGFQIAQRLRELKVTSMLIFTTYIEHQSREGYLYGAFRYVFKNNIEFEINEAISSILMKLNDTDLSLEKIEFKCRNTGVLENILVQKNNILFLEKEKNRRVILKTIFCEYELLTKPLSEYAKLLEPPIFIPIMRNFILNFNRVQGLNEDSFILTDGSSVPLGINRQVQKLSREKYLKFLKERI